MSPCTCGHLRDAHEHYRSGTDCSRCTCLRFHRTLRLPSWLAGLTTARHPHAELKPVPPVVWETLPEAERDTG